MPYLRYCQFNESSVELLRTWCCYQGLPFCHSWMIQELGQKRDFPGTSLEDREAWAIRLLRPEPLHHLLWARFMPWGNHSQHKQQGLLTIETSQGGHPRCEGSGSQAVLLRTAGMLSLERRYVESSAYVGSCVATSKYPRGFCVED